MDSQSAIARIFGRGRQPQEQKPFVQFTSEDGETRLTYHPDTSAGAVAVRHNQAAIYGADHVSPNVGMRAVIEVRDPKTGEFVPVTGSRSMVPDTDTQMAALTSFKETGIIGPQRVNPNGSMATGGESAVSAPSAGQTAGGTAGGLTFGPNINAASVNGSMFTANPDANAVAKLPTILGKNQMVTDGNEALAAMNFPMMLMQADGPNQPPKMPPMILMPGIQTVPQMKPQGPGAVQMVRPSGPAGQNKPSLTAKPQAAKDKTFQDPQQSAMDYNLF
jgi:hypothetical protein